MGGFGLWLFLLTSVTVTHFPNACLLREHFCSVLRFCFPQKHLVLHDLCAFTPGTCRAPQPLLSACEGDYALLVKTGGMLKKKIHILFQTKISLYVLCQNVYISSTIAENVHMDLFCLFLSNESVLLHIVTHLWAHKSLENHFYLHVFVYIL